MAKFETIKVGDTLWDVHKRKAGNTRLRVWGSWPVKIVSLDLERRSAKATWNGNNQPRLYTERELAKLRRTPRE